MANKEIKLKDGNDYLFPQAMLNGIDMQNVIAENITNYTAQEDCVLIVTYSDGYGFTIDGVKPSRRSGLSQYASCYFPLKKGQILANQDTNSVHFVIYAIKH